MEVVRHKAAFRTACEALRSKGRSVGLVPTMGALHEGHLSLIRAAVAGGHAPVVSIFVNPLQFGDASDLAAYPRDEAADLAACEGEGVALVFAPAVEEMYPDGEPETKVQPGPVADHLEGASRPGHFSGVATVVTKLFSLTGPAEAFFGEKDYQQLVVIRQVVSDLDLPVGIVGCPIVREPDGLALSSRNRRLGPEDRVAATCLYRALRAGETAVADGERSARAVEQAMMEVLSKETHPDYTATRDPSHLGAVQQITSPVRLLVAARVGPMRLIDNLLAVPS